MTTTDLALADVDQAKVLQALGLNVNDPKAQATLLICRRYELDPFLGHMMLVQNKPYITRDGYLHIAHRSGVFDGMEVVDEGENERAIWCKVSVWRKDMSRPFTAVGRVKKSERTQVDPFDMALTRAERRALRRAFNVAGLVDAHEPDGDALVDHDGPVAPMVAALPAASTGEPFDTASREAAPAATSEKAAKEQGRKSLAQTAQEMKANDPASKLDVDVVLGRIAAFDLEHRSMVAGLMNNAGLTLKTTPTRGDLRRIDELVADVEVKQAAAREERRKAVFVGISDAYPDGLSDEQRHDLLAKATAGLSAEDGGQTGSSKYLTEAQAHAVLDYLETISEPRAS